jgi:hypothetical protein
MKLEDRLKMGSIMYNFEELYVLKHFSEKYTAAKHLIEAPKDIRKYASQVSMLITQSYGNYDTSYPNLNNSNSL